MWDIQACPLSTEQRASVCKGEQDLDRCSRQMPTDGGECRRDAQFRAVAEGGTNRRLEREMGALNAGRNGLNFTLRLWEHFEHFKQGSDGLEKGGGHINMVRSSPVTKLDGPAVF